LRQVYLQRRKSARRTDGNGCSSWQTADWKGESAQSWRTRTDGDTTPRLADQVSLFGRPVPPTTPAGPPSSPAGPTSRRLWPTPDANVMNDGEDAATFELRRAQNLAKHINGNGMGEPLAYTAAMWSGVEHAGAVVRRRLNPRFCAWLMGFDPDWCAGLSRVDALRCYGNAVVPAQGAYAIVVLLGELARHAATATDEVA